MKKTSFLPGLIFLLLLQFSCKKEETKADTEIFGTWQLKSVTDFKTKITVTVPQNKNVLVTFNKDWKITEKYENTNPAEFAFAYSGSTFDLEDATSVRIINLASATEGGYLYKIKELNNTTLILEREQGSEYQFSRK